MSKELQDYIAQARDKGFSDKDIYDQLVGSGWKPKVVSKELGLSVPEGNNVSVMAQNSILLPVALRVIGIIFFIFVWYAMRLVFAIGGNSFQLKDHIPFFFVSYLPIILLILSIVSLLTSKGGYPFDFLSNDRLRSILRSITKVVIWIFIALFVLVILDVLVT